MKPYFKSAVYAGFGVGTLVLGAPAVLASLSPEALMFPDTALRVPAALLFVSGFVVYFACVSDFAGSGRGTPAWWDAPDRFVVNTFFHTIRNPMYAGVGAMMTGMALLLGSWLALAWVVVVMAAFHLFVTHFEEPRLRARFGRRYDAYRSRVPRWIPRSATRILTTVIGWNTLKP